MKFYFYLCFALVSACASSEESEYIGKAHPAAYAADSFLIGAPPPERENNNSMDFYFKNCDATDERSYYSNTTYFCDEY